MRRLIVDLIGSFGVICLLASPMMFIVGLSITPIFETRDHLASWYPILSSPVLAMVGYGILHIIDCFDTN